jgi:hypothetical protein
MEMEIVDKSSFLEKASPVFTGNVKKLSEKKLF